MRRPGGYPQLGINGGNVMRIQRTRRRAEKRNTFLVTLQDRIRRHLGGGIGAVTAGAFMLVGSGHALALPQGGEVAAGAAEIAQHAAEMAITQATQNAVINWNSFNIGAGERVNILQPNAQAALLNRVLGGSPSEIFGTLQANGRVFLVNPTGVLFAPGAHVDVGSLAASTMNITNADFMAGRYAFLGASDGKVINRGSLIAQNEGTIALLGRDVRNEGVIVARKGTVALAAGEAVTLDFNGDGKVGVIPGEAALAQVVENKGLVEADGGLVFMSAAAGDALTSSVVNQDGIVRAGSVNGRTGTIRMTAGEVRLGAGSRTDAGGASGGHIEIGGGWQGSGDLAHARNVNIVQGAEVHADAQADGGTGGTVAVWSDGRTDFRGAISARGKGTGAGGKIETSGRSVYITGDVNASSERGKAGEWLIDPGNLVVRNLTGSETETDSLTDAQRVSSTLSGGTSVTVQTAGGDNGANDYSLTVQDNITKTSGGDATLTLKATGSIALNADITSAAGKLDLDIISDTNHLGGGNFSIANGKQLKTFGGDLKIRGGVVENRIGFANSPNMGTSGVDIDSAVIDTRDGGGTGGTVEMAGSTTTADAGVKLSGTQIQTGTGKVTIIGKSGSGKGISIDGGSNITTRTVELRTDSLDLQGTITGDADPTGSAKIWTLSDGKTINFGAGSGELELAGNTFSSAGKITNFYKNIVGDANQAANIAVSGVTADHDLALYSGAGTLTVGGAVNAAGHALTLGSKNAITGAGVLTADALVLDAADATVNLTGTHQLGKLDGKAKGLALKNGTNLKVGADTGLTTSAGGASLDVTGSLTVGARGMTNGAGALSLKASGTLTLDPNAEVKSTGAAATALEAGAVSFGTDSKVSTAGGTIKVKTDALTLPTGAQGTLSSADGAVTVETKTAGKTMSVGAAAADVHMSDFDFINSGTGEVHLGNANTGNIDIGAADVKAPLTVESGATVKFTGALTNANGKNTTFSAGAIDFGTGASLAAGAGTMTMTADSITNWSNVTFADTTGKGTLAIKPKTAGAFSVGGTSTLVSDAGFSRIKAGNFYNVAIGDKTNAGTATIDAISSGNLPSHTSILTNGAISVVGAVQGTAADTLTLHGDGLTETAPIEVGNLLLLGKGAMDLSTQPNKIGNIAADMTEGTLKLKNQTDMKVAVVENRTVTPKANVDGLKTKSTNIKLDTGKKLTVAGNLNSTDDTQLEADNMDLGNKVNVGKTLTLEKADKTQAINVGTGANDWNIDNANYGKIKIGGNTQTGNINIKGATFKKLSDIETTGSVKLTGATKAGADGKSDMKIKAHDAALPTASDTLAVKNLDLDLSGGIDLGLGKVIGQKDGKVTARGAAASQDIYIKDDAADVPTTDYRISYRSINDTLAGFGGFDIAGEKHVYFYGGSVKKSMNAAGKLGVEVRDNVTIEGEGTTLTVGSDPSATPPSPETVITGGFTVKSGKSVSVKGKGAAIAVNTDGNIELENGAALKVEGDKADFRLKSRSHDVILGDDAAVKVLSGTEVHGDVTGTTLNLGARAVLDTGADTVGALRVHVDEIATPTADDGVTNIEGKSGLVITTRTAGRGMVVDNSTAATPGALHVTADQLNGKLFGNQFVALTLGNGQTGDVTIDGVNVDNHVAIQTGAANKVTIVTNGLTVAANRRVTLKTGSIENSGGMGRMAVGAGGTLTLKTDSIANLAANGSNPSVTGTGTLGIGTYDGTKSIGLGNAATGDLLLPDAKFGTVFGPGFTHYSIGDGTQGTINVNGSTLGKDVTLQANTINFAGDLTLAAGKALTVNAKTAAQQTAGKITATNLAALGGNIMLDQANEIGTLAADALSVNVKSNALTIGTVTIPAGSPTAQTARTLSGIKAGESGGTAGDIVLSADAMTFNEAVEGKGNLVVQEATDTTNLNVGTTGAGLTLPETIFGGNKIKDGFKHVYLGSETATGATSVGGNLDFRDPTTIRSGKTSGTMTLDGTAKIATNGNAFALESKDLTTAAGSEVNTGSGDLTLKTDKMDLNGKMKGVKALNILPLSHTQDISLGADDPTKLSLLEKYFNGNNRAFWDYEVINIGDKDGGGHLYQSGTINMPFTVNIQQAITSGSGGVNITGTINTNGKDYTIGSREVNFNNATISADNPDGVHHGNVSIQADELHHTNSKITGHGDVSFDTYTPGKTISFGTPGGGGSPAGLVLPSDIFSGTGLLQKNADGKGFRKIRIGGERAGDISVGNVTLPGGLADGVAIKTAGNVTSTGVLKTVPTLDVDAHSVNLTGANEITNLGNITSATGVAVETKGGTTVAGTITGKDAPIKITNTNGGNVSIAPGGKIVGTGTSDVLIEARGGAFKNKGGANAIQTAPGQRYVVHTEDSVENELDGLVFEFRRYGTPYGTTGSITIPAGKNAMFYAYQPEIKLYSSRAYGDANSAFFNDGSGYHIVDDGNLKRRELDKVEIKKIHDTRADSGSHSFGMGINTSTNVNADINTATGEVAKADIDTTMRAGARTYGSDATNPNEKISFTGPNDLNYKVTVDYRIVPRTVTVKGIADTKVYDGTAKQYSGYNGVTFANFANGQTAATAGIISSTHVVYTPNVDPTKTNGFAEGALHAGNYTLGVSGDLRANNYKFKYEPGTLTITKRALSFTAPSGTRVYGASNDTVVPGTTGTLAPGDTLAKYTVRAMDGANPVTERTNVGSYTMTVEGIGLTPGSRGYSSDYAVTSTPGTLTITARPLTLRAGDKARAYGADNGTAVYTGGTGKFNADAATATTGLVNGDTVGDVAEMIDPTATLTTDAGTAGLWTRIDGAAFTRGTASNYTITYVDGSFRILPREVQIAAGNASRYVNEPNPTPTYTIERGTSAGSRGLLSGDEITNIIASYAPSMTENTPFGTYEGVISVAPGTYVGGTNMANYRFNYMPGNLIIRPRGFDSNTPGGRAVISGVVVNAPRSAADGGTSSAGGNAPGVRVPESRVTVGNGTGTMLIPPDELQNHIGSWENRVVSGGTTTEAHELITGTDGSFGYDLARDRGRVGIPDEHILGGTAEAIPVLFTNGGTRDLDGIYAINYNPNKLSIQPASKKVDIPDPKEIRADSQEPMQFLYRNQGGEFKVLFGNGIVTLRPQNDRALAIVKDKDKTAERAVLASGLLTAIEDLGVTPAEIRAVYIFNVLEEDEE